DYSTPRRHAAGASPDLGDRALCVLFGVGGQCFAHPFALFVRLNARTQAFTVAGAVALEHGVELGPVDFTEFVVSGIGVELQIWVRNGETQVLRLWHSLIDVLLAQLIVGE